MRNFGTILFGTLAIVLTLFAMIWPWLWPFLLLMSVPFWLIFLGFLVRSLKP